MKIIHGGSFTNVIPGGKEWCVHIINAINQALVNSLFLLAMKRNYTDDKGEGPCPSSSYHPCEWGDAGVFPEKSSLIE